MILSLLTRAACIAALVLAVGCAPRDSLDEAAMRASQLGTAVGDARPGSGNAALDTGSRITERFYFVAKYQASLEQRRTAESTARRLAPKVAAKARARGRKAPRFLAIRAPSDARATTATSVMVWDTQSQTIVGNDIYDLNAAPQSEATVKFETYSAQYVGISG